MNNVKYGHWFIGANLSQDSITSRQRTTPASSQHDLVPAAAAQEEKETVGLKKRVGLVSGIALIVGTMIGGSILIIFN